MERNAATMQQPSNGAATVDRLRMQAPDAGTGLDIGLEKPPSFTAARRRTSSGIGPYSRPDKARPCAQRRSPRLSLMHCREFSAVTTWHALRPQTIRCRASPWAGSEFPLPAYLRPILPEMREDQGLAGYHMCLGKGSHSPDAGIMRGN